MKSCNLHEDMKDITISLLLALFSYFGLMNHSQPFVSSVYSIITALVVVILL